MNNYIKFFTLMAYLVAGYEAHATDCKAGNKAVYQADTYLCKKNGTVLSSTSCPLSNLLANAIGHSTNWNWSHITSGGKRQMMAECTPSSTTNYCALNCQ